MYWSIDKSLSHNALFNFILGARGCGKTYATTKYAIDTAINTGKKFGYLRRYQSELEEVFPTIVRPHKDNYNKEFKIDGLQLKYDDNVIGYGFSLSTSIKLKSQSFPDVDFIIFDEFIIDTGKVTYLKREVVTFLEFYETIARTRDVKVYFLSNAITITNPYFLYFNLQMPYKKDISVKNDILIEKVYNPEYSEFKKQTRFGKMLEGTEYSKYAFDNEFLLDNSDFIEKKTGKSKFEYVLVFKGVYYGVWIDYETGLCFVSNDYNPNTPFIYTLLAEDMKPNMMMIKGKIPYNVTLFYDMFKLGLVRFENTNIKNLCFEVLKYVI